MKGIPAIVVLARLDSSRLPGKALAEAGGRPLISRVVERVRRVGFEADLVLATTDRPEDDALAAHAASEGVRVHRDPCPVDEVATRFANAAAGADWAFRVNGDSPFCDPALFERAWSEFGEQQEGGGACSLATNLVERSYPYGVAVELVRMSRYRELLPSWNDPEDREHVTRGFYRDLDPSEIQKIGGGDPDWTSVRLTVDEPEDLDRFRRFLAGPGADWPITPLEHAICWYRGEGAP